MRETRLSGSEGGARFYPLSLPLSSNRLTVLDMRCSIPRALGRRSNPAATGLFVMYREKRALSSPLRIQ
jgi:hypothetical protein